MRLDELRIRQARVLAQGEPKRIARSLNLPRGSVFTGVDGVGNLVYRTASQTRPGIVHIQLILLEDLPWLMMVDEPDFTYMDRVREAVWGDLRCHCSCEDFSFGGFSYIITRMDANIPGEEENRAPRIRNPRLRGIGCKHLLNVFRVVPANMPSIVRAFRS